MAKHEIITAEVDEGIYADVEAAVAQGEFASMAEAVTMIVSDWAADRRTDRAQVDTPAFQAFALAMVEESRQDPRPSVAAEEAFADLRARYADPA